MQPTTVQHNDLTTFTGPLTLSDEWYAYTLHMDQNRLSIDVRCNAANRNITKARPINISVPDGIDYALNFYRCFLGYESIRVISELSSIDSSKIISTELMFAGLRDLTDISPLLSWWDMSNVRNMSGMFWGCEALTDLTLLSSWQVSDDCNLSGFYSCYGHGDYLDRPPLPWEEPHRHYNRMLVPRWLAVKHIEHINRPQ